MGNCLVHKNVMFVVNFNGNHAQTVGHLICMEFTGIQ